MRRTWLRGRENVKKRYLVHVAGHNLSLLMRQLIGAGTPREAVAGGYRRIHSVTVTGLTPETAYFYRVVSADKAGNQVQSATQSFTTAAGSTGPAEPGDLNGDRKVEFADFLLFAQAFGNREGESQYNPEADLDGNGVTDFSDFLSFAVLFGRDYAAPKPTQDVKR